MATKGAAFNAQKEIDEFIAMQRNADYLYGAASANGHRQASMRVHPSLLGYHQWLLATRGLRLARACWYRKYIEMAEGDEEKHVTFKTFSCSGFGCDQPREGPVRWSAATRRLAKTNEYHKPWHTLTGRMHYYLITT